jgi:hypothetical protein
MKIAAATPKGTDMITALTVINSEPNIRGKIP